MSQKSSRRQRSAPTISDVAAAAGVSPMTVSRVINGEANVRAATRDLVNVAIQQLGYAPNRAARSLAGAEELRIGLLYSNPSAAYLSEFLVGGLEQASRGNLQLIVEQCEIDDHEVKAAEHLVRIEPRRIFRNQRREPPLGVRGLVLEQIQPRGQRLRCRVLR